MNKIVYFTECNCGGKATSAVIDFTQEKEVIEIDIEFDVFDIELECKKCGRRYFVSGQVEEVE